MMSPILHFPTDEGYLPGSSMYLHVATVGAGRAINRWLRRIERGLTYRFEVERIECSLEFSTEPGVEIATYALVEGGRWRWGRLDNGDPDEDGRPLAAKIGAMVRASG